MTVKEFQSRYHNYCVQDFQTALNEIENMEPVEESGQLQFVEAIYLPGVGWAIMLDTAIRALGM